MPTEETLEIEKLVYGGEGLARLDGKVILAPFVLPGEKVRADVDRVKNDLFRGRLLEVIAPAAARVEPSCPYFGRCGGCQYQHIEYNEQLEQKRSILREVLRRVGKIELDREIELIAGEPWQYRNRIQLHVRDGSVGYFEHGSQKLCAIDHCPIASPALNDAIAKLAASRPRTDNTVELFTNESGIQVNLADHAPRAEFEKFAALGITGAIEYDGFQVSRGSFFQVNRFLIDRLVECAIGESTGGSAIDLYAGVGLFAIRLAARFRKVIAVESGWSAFRDLEHNVSRSAVPVTPINAAVENYLAALAETPELILSDPPRAGLGKQSVRELVRIRSPRLVIVSCDPATLARDLQGLLGAGYRIDTITLIDLFPQTFHLETVVQLSAPAETRE